MLHIPPVIEARSSTDPEFRMVAYPSQTGKFFHFAVGNWLEGNADNTGRVCETVRCEYAAAVKFRDQLTALLDTVAAW